LKNGWVNDTRPNIGKNQKEQPKVSLVPFLPKMGYGILKTKPQYFNTLKTRNR
jgi:hypothetical protein